MEISQKNKNERVEYNSTINGQEATCNIMVQNGVRKGARVSCNGISLRKPGDEIMVEFNCKVSEIPSDLTTHLESLTEFLELCISKHE